MAECLLRAIRFLYYGVQIEKQQTELTNGLVNLRREMLSFNLHKKQQQQK